MKNIVASVALAGAAFIAAPAAAQTAGTTGAPSGGRVEAVVGYDRVRVDLSDLGTNDTFKDEGALYGVGAGYDFALGNGSSLGVDVEATDSTARESAGGASVKAGRDLYAGGRVSIGIAPNSNVYLKGGYTNARFKASAPGVSDSENLDGYRLGAGAQFGLGGKAYVGGEYRYSSYENDVSRHQIAATVGTRF